MHPQSNLDARRAATGPRACRLCGRVADLQTYRWNGVYRDTACDECRAGVRRRQLAARNRRRNYGLSEGQYAGLLRAQAGLCAICGQAETAHMKGLPKSLGVDHDHATGAIRGLLCSRCNAGLGAFRDSPELLLAAAEYLRRCEAPGSLPGATPAYHVADLRATVLDGGSRNSVPARAEYP